MASLLFPRKALQREAEEALALARQLIDAHSDEYGIVRLAGLTITSDKKILPDNGNHVLTVYRDIGDESETVLYACWDDADDGPPFFIEYKTGGWRWIMRRALKTET